MLFVIGLVWCVLALGVALATGRAIRLRDLRDSGLYVQVPDADMRTLHRV